MNPKLVEEVARAIEKAHVTQSLIASERVNNEGKRDDFWVLARAAIRVCMARAAEIARSHATCTCGGKYGRCTENDGPLAVADAIKREGGLG